MQLKVESTTKESRQARGRTYWGVKSGGNWYNLMIDQKPSVGQTFEVTVKESQYNNKTYRWAEIDQKAQAKQQSNDTGHSWWDYRRMAELAHELAKELEPDETGSEAHFEDRSSARAAIVNTAMINFCQGRISLPEDEEENQAPPPGDDDVPF